MAMKGSPLYYLRCFQLCFALAFLIVICWSGVHRGWWDNVTGAIALGVITSLITLFIIGHAIFIQFRNNPFSARGNAYQIVRLVIEVTTFLLWVATIVLMLRHKGGCEVDVTTDGVEGCSKDGNPPWREKSNQPIPQWWIALAFAFVNAVSFIPSTFLVFKDNRANKVGDGPSYA